MPKPPFHSLRPYLTALEAAGDLARIKVEVDPKLELAQITQEAVRRDGPALLFERVKGSPFPVATNLLGSMRRIELAFGRHPAAIGAELGRLGERLMPPTIRAVLSEWRALLRLRHMRPARGCSPKWTGPETDLDAMPVLFSQPGDAGRFLTFGLVMSANVKSGKQNLGVYRMQVRDARSLLMHWQIQKGGSTHAAEHGAPRMPVAIAIGTDPATMFAAICPLPEDVDELHFAGLLRGGSTRLAKGGIVPLEVPAEAEFLLEGHVHLDRLEPEGPFGDHFGHYSHQSPFPVFEAAAIRARKDPIYVASVVGKPPQEDRAIGEAITSIFTPIVRLIHPELVDMWAYQEAGFHNLLVVSTRQRYAKEGIKTALGLLGQGQLSLTKVVVLVDPEVNVRSFPEVLRAIRAHVDPAEDVQVLHRTSQDTLDFTSQEMNLGSKLILDATAASPSGKPSAAPEATASAFNPVPGMGEWRVWEDGLFAMKPGSEAVAAPAPSGIWQERRKPAADAGEGRALLERFLAANRYAGFKLVAVVSDDVDLSDDASLLWGIFTRFDCARDLAFAESSIRGAWPKLAGPIGIDATFKRGYPDPVTMRPDILGLVKTRWKDYPLPF